MTPPEMTKMELIQLSETQRQALLEDWAALARGSRSVAVRVRTAVPLAVAALVILGSLAFALMRKGRR